MANAQSLIALRTARKAARGAATRSLLQVDGFDESTPERVLAVARSGLESRRLQLRSLDTEALNLLISQEVGDAALEEETSKAMEYQEKIDSALGVITFLEKHATLPRPAPSSSGASGSESPLALAASAAAPAPRARLRTLLYRCLLYTSPSPRDLSTSRMPSSA